MFLKDYCQEKYAEWSSKKSFLENCALSHFNEQKGLGDHMHTLTDFDKLGDSIDYIELLKKVHKGLLYTGVAVSMVGVAIKQKYMVFFIGIAYLGLSLPFWF